MSFEVLDNMPHDRLYKSPGSSTWDLQTLVTEDLQEVTEPITDRWCQMYVDLERSMPAHDHISSRKVLDREGILSRLSSLVFA